MEERGQTMAEGRLRLARLLDSSYNISGPFQGVEVGRAGLRMMLFRTVHDHASGVEQYAVTWQRGLGWVDAQGADAVADARFILQGLSEDLDHFIGDYLRVNEGYC